MVFREVRFLPYLQLNNNHKLIYTNKYSTMKTQKNNTKYLELQRDLISFYEIDIDNCKMTDIDWVTEIAKLISDHKYKLTPSDITK